VADVTELDERHDEPYDEGEDDTDPGRRWLTWRASGNPAARPTPKHKAPRRVKPERPPREGGSFAGAVAGLLVVLLIGSNVALWIRQEEDKGARVEPSRIARVVAAQQALSDQIDELRTSIEDVKGSVSTVQQSVEQSVASTNTAPLAEQLTALQAKADALTTCVNTYMDALAAWTRNIAAPFVYTRC
jgi:uncharacterized protein HemX